MSNPPRPRWRPRTACSSNASATSPPTAATTRRANRCSTAPSPCATPGPSRPDDVIYAQLHLTLPAWIHDEVDGSRLYPDDESRIALAIQLSRRNVDHRSGGPFGAAVFSGEGRLVGVGVNRVVPHNCSVAHAEVMALATSQQRVQSFRLNQSGERYTLATS